MSAQINVKDMLENGDRLVERIIQDGADTSSVLSTLVAQNREVIRASLNSVPPAIIGLIGNFISIDSIKEVLNKPLQNPVAKQDQMAKEEEEFIDEQF